MRHPVWMALALASALALAGCGGGSSPSAPTLSTVASVNAASTAPTTGPTSGFKQVVVFGDSLSDDGAYTPAALSAYSNALFTGTLPYALGGQFTVNSGPIWVTDLANQLGVALSPNLMGYAGTYFYIDPNTMLPATSSTPVYCPYGTASNCVDFAQGGAMVSNPDGIGHSTGALTVPVTQQVQNYLSQFSSFNGNQLITVLAGNNDVFTALSTVQTQVASGVAQTQAVAQAQATVGEAADALAGVVQNILSKGGKYVLVYTLPDSSLTPFGQSLAGGTTCNNQDPTQACYLLSNLVQVFNQRLLNDLQGTAVKMVDGYALLNDEIANPSKYSLTNVTVPWCDPTKTQNSSLLCNSDATYGTPYTAAGATSANLSTWLFADSVHPTPAGYKIIANATLGQMKSFGWVQ